jgi:diaminopimelate epimerase
MTHIHFTKMHGAGNDYIHVNGREESITDPAALSRAMSDRRLGVGADGLILVLPPDEGIDAHVRMRMFNADGTEAEMCGNGIRCVCKYAHDRGLARARPMRVQTAAGVLALDYTLDAVGRIDCVTVDMGEPVVDLPEIPVDARRLTAAAGQGSHTFEVNGATWVGTFVSMGNPHVVLFGDDNPRQMSGPLDELELSRWGKPIECHPAFPRRMNVHWVRVVSRSEVIMRTWERGSGVTLACGTGAAAVCAAGVVTGRTDRRLLARLPGGELRLRWDEATDHLFLTGPAVEVFSGVWPVPAGARR